MTKETQGSNELETLKKRADMMGIKYHPKTGVTKLKGKIYAAMQEDDTSEVTSDTTKVESLEPTRAELHKQATLHKRVVITCNNPDKKDWDGEIFSVGNAVVGTIKKYVPFNDSRGFHVPSMLLEVIRDKDCTIIKERKEDGRMKSTQVTIKEFNVTELDALTPTEIAAIAKRQAAARIDS